jgi:two-component system chemotaxis sensor kinase CheA
MSAEIAHTPYAIPIESVETVQLVSRSEILALQGSQAIHFQDEPVSVVWLADLLELRLDAPASATAIGTATKTIPCIILKIGSERLGLLVDSLSDRQDIFLKPQSKLLKREEKTNLRNIYANKSCCLNSPRKTPHFRFLHS